MCGVERWWSRGGGGRFARLVSPRVLSEKKGGARPAPGMSHSTHHAASATAAHLASAELGVARMAWGQKAAGGSGARVAWGEVMKASENDAKQRWRGVAERDAPVSRLDRRKKGEVPSRVRGCRNGHGECGCGATSFVRYTVTPHTHVHTKY